jgi:tRNA pseudouridine55 synthase
MGRRKGTRVDGWLVIDKPAGPTSAAIVNRVRWMLGAQKAGHAGTLDPAATGLLAVALGEATKTIPFVEGALKSYRFRVRWGQATDTDDAEGQVIAEHPHRPDEAAIRAALPRLTGDILQTPPAFSAVKVAGARAYDLARAGEVVALAARPLHVAGLDLTGMPDPDHADLAMICGKGGYVRAIARDLGVMLGTVAHVLWLRRTWSGPFTLDQAIPADLLAQDGADLTPHILPLEAALRDLPCHPVPPDQATRLQNGNPLPLNAPNGPCWLAENGKARALGRVTQGVFHPDRMILP